MYIIKLGEQEPGVDIQDVEFKEVFRSEDPAEIIKEKVRIEGREWHKYDADQLAHIDAMVSTPEDPKSLIITGEMGRWNGDKKVGGFGQRMRIYKEGSDPNENSVYIQRLKRYVSKDDLVPASIEMLGAMLVPQRIEVLDKFCCYCGADEREGKCYCGPDYDV